MKIAPFATEHFYAQYEFTTPYQLCNSDCESVSVAELMKMANMPLDQIGQLSLGYTESQGHPQLREKIADDYAMATAEDIMMLATPVEGIYLTARAVLSPGDEVVVVTPAYDALINMFEHVVEPATSGGGHSSRPRQVGSSITICFANSSPRGPNFWS